MTRIRIVTLALTASLALAACSATPESTLKETPGSTVPFSGEHVSIDTWTEAAAGEDVIILDVRTPEEYAGGHISGAINVNLNSGSFETDISTLDPDASYAVYCHSGNRSRAAIDIMATLGITKTIGLDGGVGAWTAAGYLLVTE